MSDLSASLTRISSCIAAACLAASATLLGVPSASASTRVEPCIWPSTGTDLQQYFQVSVALVVPHACNQIKTGASWSTPSVFYVARTWEQVPAGYHPTTATPRDELVAHLTKVRFIVDEGTPQEFTVERTGRQLSVLTASWQEVYPDDPDWLLVDIGTHITLRPLPVGQHTVRGQFVLDAPACDGTSSVWEMSCIPAGEFDYPETRTFTVAATG